MIQNIKTSRICYCIPSTSTALAEGSNSSIVHQKKQSMGNSVIYAMGIHDPHSSLMHLLDPSRFLSLNSPTHIPVS
jgi:hypothetical protein